MQPGQALLSPKPTSQAKKYCERNMSEDSETSGPLKLKPVWIYWLIYYLFIYTYSWREIIGDLFLNGIYLFFW